MTGDRTLLTLGQTPAGPTPASGGVDLLTDAGRQLQFLQTYFAVLSSGGNPTATQIAQAQAALVSLQADIDGLQKAQATLPPQGQMWVSLPAAVGMALGAGFVGGAIGYVSRGSGTSAARSATRRGSK